MKSELYFVARMKDNELLFLTDGPFIEQVEAEIICEKQPRRRCYSQVVKTTLEFEVVG